MGDQTSCWKGACRSQCLSWVLSRWQDLTQSLIEHILPKGWPTCPGLNNGTLDPDLAFLELLALGKTGSHNHVHVESDLGDGECHEESWSWTRSGQGRLL